jgi:hypothetical protein
MEPEVSWENAISVPSPLILIHIPIVLFETRRKHMRAVAARDEIEIGNVGGVRRSLE